VLQNLGKANKTSDAAFEQHVLNFYDQQVVLFVLFGKYYFLPIYTLDSQ